MAAVEARRPDVVDGEVLDATEHPPSPLDPNADGVWPTVLRPAPVTERIDPGSRRWKWGRR